MAAAAEVTETLLSKDGAAAADDIYIVASGENADPSRRILTFLPTLLVDGV